jgi:hypothetical protein
VGRGPQSKAHTATLLIGLGLIRLADWWLRMYVVAVIYADRIYAAVFSPVRSIKKSALKLNMRYTD